MTSLRPGPSTLAESVLLGVIGLMLALGLMLAFGLTGEAREPATLARTDPGSAEPATAPLAGGPVVGGRVVGGPVVGGSEPEAPLASSPICMLDPAFERYLARLNLTSVRAEAALREAGGPVEVADQIDPNLPQDRPAAPGGGDAPVVAVRAGEHPGFARIVFDWPEAVAYQVLRRAGQVTLAFDRAGRIDLWELRERLGGWVTEARTDGAAATRRVVLQVRPDAKVRSFSLDGDRVVLDLLEGAVLLERAMTPATATPAVDPVAGPVADPAADPVADPVAELRQALQERDAVIEDLLARVGELERRPLLASAELDRVAAGEGADGAGSAAGSASTPALSPDRGPQTASQDQGGEAAPTSSAPGAFEVEEEEIDRALERTLVQAGALLLPFGRAEIEPSFSFTRQEVDSPAFFTDNGTTFVGEQKVRRNEYLAGMDLRFGLPFDAQLELGVPYRYVDQSAVTEVGFTTLDGDDGSGSGFGDLSVGLAKTLLRENRWWPDLVGRITWDTDTGETTDNDVVLGGGFHELRGSLSAVKRQDPLAFTAGLSYESTFEKDDVKPGDEFGFSIGAVLAASAETSLHVAFDQRFGDDVQIGGQSINGSDLMVGMASIGASVIIDHGALLDVTADVGLTEDAPDYAVHVSLPIRFNLPIF